MIEHFIKAATCRVVCSSESGTGWLIGQDRVVTARHCVLANIDNDQPVELFFPDSGDVAVIGKIVAQSEDLDACLLSLETTTTTEPLPVSLELPHEGETWQTFGYPQSKSTLGHRLSGTVAQALESPKLKVDLDLSIETNIGLQSYNGMSGAAVVCQGAVIGIIRLKVDGTVAGLSLNQLEEFLTANGVNISDASPPTSTPLLANRDEFSKVFSEAVSSHAGKYLFLEGAHGYGKSTFCEEFRADDRTFISLGAYRLSDPNSVLGADYRAQPQVFFDWLTTRISVLITGHPPRKGEKSYTEQVQESVQYLDKFSKYCAASGKLGMFFIDGLNEVPGEALLVQLLGLLPATLPSEITVVLTAPNFLNTVVPLGGRVNASDVLKLPPLSASACYRFCQKALKNERRLPVLIDRICQKANGHPLYLRYLIEYVNLQEANDDLEDFPDLIGSIEEYYQGVWAKLLPDSDAVDLLALMARLRWRLSAEDFVKALSPTEQTRFISVMSRIRHLLENEESISIYHTSFADFIIKQTAAIQDSAYRRLAKFCTEEPDVHYCILNRVFHLSLAGDSAVFAECNQAWFDTAVTLGVEPGALIADVDTVVKRAALEASADEFFRLTLLAQRISFRYDTLFAQSAHLIAEALIVLGRPAEALQHVLRLKTLIVDPDDTLKVAFLLHHHGYDDDALTLLARLQQHIIESYNAPMQLDEFLRLCSWHIQTVFYVRLAGGWNGMKQVMSLTDRARRVCGETFKDDPSWQDEFLCPVLAISPTYFLTFMDVYVDIDGMKEFQKSEEMPETELPSHYLITQCVALLNFESTVDNYHLPKSRTTLTKLFEDLAKLIPTAEIETLLASAVTDTLIRFGASARIVELFAAKGDKQPARPLQIKAKNGVDVNHEDLEECLYDWRVAAYLDPAFHGASAGLIAGTGWLESVEHLIGALYCCDGKARRAKADSNEEQRVACREQLKIQVIEPLRFTLEQRAAWRDSYAVPENVLPAVYRQLAELLIDCFPEELPEWLDNLVSSADSQWGMYSEGFRASANQVLEQLTREQPNDELVPRLLGLLYAWQDHVIRGVENRHELVPEILRLILFFVKLEAKEEAERLYQRLLSVSMGPTWYKEAQLGIMTEVLDSITVTTEVRQRLPKIAGYLERASGEMTFQRYVRAEKSSLLGQIARRGKYRAALAYFRRQCCGSMEELWAEAEQESIDKVGPLKGNRFPGGGLDDQAAVLTLVQNSETVSWALRWALLEIFHCGDSRHLTNYAETFAKIANEVGALPELVIRAEIVASAETRSDDRSSFASAFRSELKPELHEAFATMFVGLPPVTLPEPSVPRTGRETDDIDADGDLFNPGGFGRQKALRDADKVLKEAEKQWALGNHSAAKRQAVKVLQTAQEGGWSIWGNLSDGARRAEEILVKEETSAADVIRYYAPLIEAERYVAKWIPAQHLIGKVGQLLNETESQRLLDAVIEHVRLMVGEAPQEIHAFEFLADDTSELSPAVDFFQFIVWLCNHPQWLRRERAAAMLLWLVEHVPELLAETVTTAFSMDEGYGPDVLCGVLDGTSAREPAALWDKITGVLDLTMVTQELRHLSRMVVLERIATRADAAGSPSAKSALELIKASFTGERKTDDRVSLPSWANALASEWPRLRDLCNSAAIADWERELAQLCYPLSIIDAQRLEEAVMNSFLESRRPLDRWESKLRYALNLALWPYIPADGANLVEAILRIYNPSQPERFVLGMSNAFTDDLMAAVESGDYLSIFGSNETIILNYHDMAVKPTKDGIMSVEVLCLLQHSSQQIICNLQLDQSFRSSELPQVSTVRTSLETCCRLQPEVLFFGPFTPAIPLPFFQNLVGVKDEDFVRINWRYSRRSEVLGFGQPERCGCSLSIPRHALKIPTEFKLAWIVWIDRKVVAIVDEHNNHLM